MDLLILAAGVLGAAGKVYREAMNGGVVLLGVALVVVALSRQSDAVVRLLAMGLLTVAWVAPWQVWLAVHHIHPEDAPPALTAVSPGYLIDRVDRVGVTIRFLSESLPNQGLWNWIVPVFVVIAVAALGAVRRLAAYYLGGVLALVGALLFAYWTLKADIEFIG